jgi:hypothetical protein
MMILYLSLLAAFAAVFGMPCFLVYCNKALDAEAVCVETYPRGAAR